MTEVNQSPITLSEVLSETQKYDVMFTHVLNAEENRVIKYNKYFDAEKIQELILELFEDMQYAVENDIPFFENEEQLIKYEMLLIIKYFSHFKEEIGNNFEEKIVALHALFKTGLFDLFFEELFLENEVVNVMERVNQTAERAVFIEKEVKEQLEKVENKEILKK